MSERQRRFRLCVNKIKLGGKHLMYDTRSAGNGKAPRMSSVHHDDGAVITFIFFYLKSRVTVMN